MTAKSDVQTTPDMVISRSARHAWSNINRIHLRQRITQLEVKPHNVKL